MSILSTFYYSEVVTILKHKLSASGNYYIPPKGIVASITSVCHGVYMIFDVLPALFSHIHNVKNCPHFTSRSTEHVSISSMKYINYFT